MPSRCRSGCPPLASRRPAIGRCRLIRRRGGLRCSLLPQGKLCRAQTLSSRAKRGISDLVAVSRSPRHPIRAKTGIPRCARNDNYDNSPEDSEMHVAELIEPTTATERPPFKVADLSLAEFGRKE